LLQRFFATRGRPEFVARQGFQGNREGLQDTIVIVDQQDSH
jgi:hypothetical protein